MKELFEKITAAIEQVTAVRWVDFDLGQLDTEGQPPVSYPCALVGFDSGTFQNLSGQSQQAEINVRIRCAFRTFERTHSKNSTNFRNVGLAHLDTLDAIHEKLQGLDGSTFRALMRSSMRQEPRADLRVYELIYSCLLEDYIDNDYTPIADHPDSDGDTTLCTDFETSST